MGDFLLKYSPTKNIQVAGLLATVHVHSAGMLSSFVLNASTAEASLYTRAADSTSSVSAFTLECIPTEPGYPCR